MSLGLRAQDSGFGVRVGLNVSNLTESDGSNSANYDPRTSFLAGLAYEMPFSKANRWFIETGLYLSDKGFRQNSSSNLSVQMMYLEIPAVVGYRFKLGNTWGLSPYLGLYYGYCVRGWAKGDAMSGYDLFNPPSGTPQLFVRSDFGMPTGVKFDYKKFRFIAAWDMGILDITKSNSVTTHSARLSTFNLTVGYNF